MFCLPMQIDGRNGVDLVVGAKGNGAQIGWLQAPGNARDLAAWQWHPLYEAGWIMSLVSFDMDGDGDQDIIASDRKGSKRGCLWLENPGPVLAERPWREHRIGTGNREIMFLDVVDFDNDGLVDVLAAVRRGPLVYYRRMSVSPIGWREYQIELPGNTGTGKGVGVGDLDLDGRLDIVFSCESASEDKSGVVWLSQGQEVTDSHWTPHEVSGPQGIKFDLIELLDLDQDGDLDVLTCEERSNLGVIWYENPAR